MRRTSYKKYLILVAILLSIMSLPVVVTERMRSTTIAFFSPLWKAATKPSSSLSKTQVLQNDCKRLESENHLLRIEITKLKALIEQQAVYENLEKEGEVYASKNLHRRREETVFLLGAFSHAIPAQVIYRDPAHWSSSLWIGVGEETNQILRKKVIQKNSPVVVGKGVVGAIDYVGAKQSRVRLITDVGLNPSVRVVRGYPHHEFLAEQIDTILRTLHAKNDLPISQEEAISLIPLLQIFKNRLLEKKEGLYLAKGVLQGSGSPLWRASGHALRGIGFNYDYADEEGPARDLLSGKPVDVNSSLPAASLLKVSDLLVTTGMDGVFPPGLRVGEVTKIYPSREGAYTYEIEAIPVLGHLDELFTLFVLPPVGFDPNNQPR